MDAYRGGFSKLESIDDAVKLKLTVHVGLLLLDVSRFIDSGGTCHFDVLTSSAVDQGITEEGSGLLVGNGEVPEFGRRFNIW